MADQENDEDIWDSWEDMAESGELERRMEEREREHMKLRDEIDKKLFDPGVRVLVDTDSTRTQYIPQVRILRRDPNDSATVSSSNQTDTSKKVHKTLAQREKEYADARARILGEAAEEIAEETWYEISKRSFLIISFLIIVFGGSCFLAVSEIFLFAWHVNAQNFRHTCALN